MRIRLQQALESIKDKVFNLFYITKENISLSIMYLLGEAPNALERIRELEIKSDYINLNVIEECITVLVRQQPVAKDARFVVAMMEISSFFERINDLSLEISELHPTKVKNPKLEKIKNNIMWMIKRIIYMIDVNEESLRTGRIVNIDNTLSSLDNDIDNLYNESLRLLIDYLRESKEDVEDAVKLLYIIRHLERIGDIVAKTGSRIIYIEKGKWIFIK